MFSFEKTKRWKDREKPPAFFWKKESGAKKTNTNTWRPDVASKTFPTKGPLRTRQSFKKLSFGKKKARQRKPIPIRGDRTLRQRLSQQKAHSGHANPLKNFLLEKRKRAKENQYQRLAAAGKDRGMGTQGLDPSTKKRVENESPRDYITLRR